MAVDTDPVTGAAGWRWARRGEKAASAARYSGNHQHFRRCLAEAADEDSMRDCHMAAHGLMPHDVIEVGEPQLAEFMVFTQTDDHHRVIVDGHGDTALRAIMFTDIAGSTATSTSEGDAAAVELVREHDRVVANRWKS